MAYSEAQRTALQTALANGVRRVSYDGRTVEYRDLAEIRQALQEVEAGLAAAAGTRVRQLRTATSKGLR